MVGWSGIGKSHIIQALGQKVCVQGYRVYRPHVEKHPLWSGRRSTLDAHKPYRAYQTDSIPIGVCDDVAYPEDAYNPACA
jgi:hypothetical protein